MLIARVPLVAGRVRYLALQRVAQGETAAPELDTYRDVSAAPGAAPPPGAVRCALPGRPVTAGLPQKLPLYEAYAAIWASDDLQYHGGGVDARLGIQLVAQRDGGAHARSC